MATTVREMEIQFRQRLMEWADVELIPETDTLMGYFNRAQESLILDIMQEEYANETEPDGVLKRIGANRTFIKNTDDLAPVVESGDVLNFNYVESFSLPSDFVYYIKSLSALSRNEATATYVENRLTSFSLIDNYITNDDNIPYIRNPIIILKENGYCNVIHDYESEVTGIQLVYIRKPKMFSLTTNDTSFTTTAEISDNLIRQIVDIAAINYLQDKGKKVTLAQMQLGNLPKGQIGEVTE